MPHQPPPATFGRFEAERPNVRWVGDALHGPLVAGRKAILMDSATMPPRQPPTVLSSGGVWTS